MPVQRPRIAAFASRRIEVGARSWRTPGFGPVVSERSASIRLLLLAGGGDSAVRRLFVLHSLAHGYGLMTSGPGSASRRTMPWGSSFGACGLRLADGTLLTTTAP